MDFRATAGLKYSGWDGIRDFHIIPYSGRGIGGAVLSGLWDGPESHVTDILIIGCRFTVSER